MKKKRATVKSRSARSARRRAEARMARMLANDPHAWLGVHRVKCRQRPKVGTI